MEVRFNTNKEERKALVRAISEITEQEAVYQGAPSFAFTVGMYTISRAGSLMCEGMPDEMPILLNRLAERGYVHEEPERKEAPAQETAAYDEAGKKAIIVDMPFFTDSSLDNLRKLIAGKAALIRKVIGADDLIVAVIGGALHFNWFRPEATVEELGAYKQFVTALCLTAKKQKRVILKEKPLDENASEKFAFRCFLLKIGFIGDEYKAARKILLSGLPGNGSHRTGSGRKAAPEGAQAADSDGEPGGGAVAPEVTDPANFADTVA